MTNSIEMYTGKNIEVRFILNSITLLTYIITYVHVQKSQCEFHVVLCAQS